MSQGMPDSPDNIQPPPDDRPPADDFRPLALTQDDRTMGLLAHILGIPAPVFGPLIIWLIKKDQSRFVDDQGKEALNFQLTLLIGQTIGVVVTFVTCGIGVILNLALAIVGLVFCIIAAVEANKGTAYRYPVNIRFIK
jgi:uncharacterized Tic20 family protein